MDRWHTQITVSKHLAQLRPIHVCLEAVLLLECVTKSLIVSIVSRFQNSKLEDIATVHIIWRSVLKPRCKIVIDSDMVNSSTAMAAVENWWDVMKEGCILAAERASMDGRPPSHSSVWNSQSFKQDSHSAFLLSLIWSTVWVWLPGNAQLQGQRREQVLNTELKYYICL